ncbi:MAG: hypothetical protein U5J64_06725 [Halobacteriales archaeon]|nr:hypothetical protein [Halobacteriales archaeon]
MRENTHARESARTTVEQKKNERDGEAEPAERAARRFAEKHAERRERYAGEGKSAAWVIRAVYDHASGEDGGHL